MLKDIVSIAALGNGGAALDKDGSVYTWGLGTSGQLGNSASANSSVPVKISSLANITQIAGYVNHMLALGDDGALWSWGLNSNGQLGIGSTTLSNKPVKVQNTTKTADLQNTIILGNGGTASHSAVILVDGSVAVFGSNSNLQLAEVGLTQSTLPLFIKAILTLDKTNIKIQPEEEVKLNVTMNSFNVIKTSTNNLEEVEYKSLNSNIATIDENGNIKGIKNGVTTILVRDTISGQSTTCRVTVGTLDQKVTPKVVSGISHTVALKADGSVWTWGLNGNGQLGNGSLTNSYIPSKIDIDDVIDISAGQYYTLLLKSDGTVWAFGQNNYGQLGDGTNVTRTTPVQVVGLSNITQISAGNIASYALDKNGNVWSWGYGGEGRLGDGTTTTRYTPAKVLNNNKIGYIDNVIQISAGDNYATVLKADGTVWAWGYNYYGQLGNAATANQSVPVQVKDTTGTSFLRNVIKVQSGSNTTVALRADGTVLAWGRNNAYQLGNGASSVTSTSKSTLPISVKGVGNSGTLSDVIDISLKYSTTIALKSDGTAVAWGYNPNGAIGDGSTSNRNAPVVVKGVGGLGTLDNIMTVATGYKHSVAVKEDGSVYTFGLNSSGELGNDTTTNSTTPICISGDEVVVDKPYIEFNNLNQVEKVVPTLTPGFNILYDKIESDNFTFESMNESIATVDENGNITSKREGSTYIRITNVDTGIVGSTVISVLQQNTESFPAIVAGENHTIALKADGSVWAWGLNSSGQLGLGDNIERLEPTYIGIDDVVKIAAGYNFTLLLKKDGTVWAFGQNNYGQLGDGTTANKLYPVQVRGENGYLELKDIIDISAGAYFGIALKSDGTVYSWGYNVYGQLGNGSTTNSSVPVRVRYLKNIVQISAGTSSIHALKADGSVWSCGYGKDGRLGNGATTEKVSLPVRAKDVLGTGYLADIIQISGGGGHVLALSIDKTVWSFGANGSGQLGIGNTTNKTLPNKVLDLNFVERVETKRNTNFAILTDGTVWTWGLNDYGQLGDNTKTNRNRPVQMKGELGKGEFENPIAIGATNTYTVIADTDGRVYSLGYNAYGQLGDNTKANKEYLVCISKEEVALDTSFVRLNNIGDTHQINANANLGFNLIKDDLENATFEYESKDETIASVSNDGLITAKSYGKTEIIVRNTIIDKYAIVEVTILRPGHVTMPKVETGCDFTVALKSDGTVWTWGYNGYGQLATGDTVNLLEPTKVDIPKIVDIAVGYNHVLAIDLDGYVWSWGLNNYGQLGDNTTVNKVRPVKLDTITNAVKVTAGEQHSLVLTKDGKLYGFGRNNYGQIGDSTTTNRSVPTLIKGLSNIKDVKANGYHNIALTYDGLVYTWGYNGYGQLGIGNTLNKIAPTQVPSLEDVKEIDVGRYFSEVVKNDGTVWTFGYNADGELGNGTKTNSSVPVQVVSGALQAELGSAYLQNVRTIGIAQYHTYAILEDGRVVSWGYNANGQLGNGTTANQTVPVLVKDDNFSIDFGNAMLVDGTYYGGIIVQNNGVVWTTGKNNYGQIGDGSTVNKNYLVCISNISNVFNQNPVKLIEGGDSFKLEITTTVGFNLLFDVLEDSTYTFEIKDEDIATVDEIGNITPGRKGKTDLNVVNNETGRKTIVPVYVLSEGDKTFPKVSSWTTHTLALKSDGSVWSWGDNSKGQLGDGTTTNRKYPIDTGIRDAIDVAAGAGFSLVLKEDGTVLAFGENTYGKLGTGNTAQSLVPVQVKNSDGTGILSDIVQIAVAYSHALALDSNGNIWAWGSNNYGQLGDGTTVNKSLPVKVKNLNNVVKIAAGNISDRGNSYAIKDNGTAWGWGHGGCGSIGNGSTANQSTPVQISNLSKVVDIKGGYHSTAYAVTENGYAYAWGHSSNGDTTDVTYHISTPQRLKDVDGTRMTNVAEIIPGVHSVIALKKDGTAVAWGVGTSGQLSNGTNANTATPTIVKDKTGNIITDIILASAGDGFSSFVKSDGTVWTVGKNNIGQLGDNTTTNSNLASTISINTIELNTNEVILSKPGNQFKLEAQIIPGFNLLYNNAINSNIEYKSLNESIAVVDTTGRITGLLHGKTQIIVKDTTTGIEQRVTVKVLNEGDLTFPDVVPGDNHTIALKANGSIWTWGQNTYGQLGTGDTTAHIEPKMVNFDEDITFTAIVAGTGHNLAVDKNGDVWVWGLNNYGQLGDNTKVNKTTPIKLETIGSVQKVAAYGNISVALTLAGEVYAWGNGFGVIPVRIPLNMKALAITHNLVLLADGTVWSLNVTTPVKVAGLSKICAISSGYNHNLALDNDGTVWAWGTNTYGQIGDGTQTSRTAPVVVKDTNKYDPLPDVVEISAGREYSTALTKNGTMLVWGRNNYGQLANGLNTGVDTVARKITNPQNMMVLNAGDYHITSATSEGYVWVWGNNNNGQLGTEDKTNRYTPTLIGKAVIAISSREEVLKVGDTVDVKATLNNSFNLLYDVVDSNGITYKVTNEDIASISETTVTGESVGRTGVIATHTGTNKTAVCYLDVVENESIYETQAGEAHSVALKADGSVWTWGANNYGQLGDKTNTDKTKPVNVTLNEKIKQISGVGNHALALDQNGNVWSWGLNSYGQLGDGTPTNRNNPVQVITSDGSVLSDIVRIATGENYSIALDKYMQVWIWGYGYSRTATKLVGFDNIQDIANKYALTINGTVKEIATGAIIENLTNIIKISSSSTHTFALAADGTAWGWGQNTKGQLGIGTTINSSVPVKVKAPNGMADLTNIKEIKAGYEYSIAVLKEGTVYTFGNNANYKLGTDLVDMSALPIRLSGINALSVDAGYEHSLIIENTGRVYSFGLGENGRLGNNSYETSKSLQLVGLGCIQTNESNLLLQKGETFDITAVSGTFNVISDSNTPVVIGYESNDTNIVTVNALTGTVIAKNVGTAQIIVKDTKSGNFSIVKVTVMPVNVTIEPMVDTYSNHSVALKANGSIWTWGDNSFGELGDGTTASKTEPIQIGANLVSASGEQLKFIKVAAGNGFTVAIDEEGNVWTWGLNSTGQLGIGNYTNKLIPTKITTISNITNISAGADFVIALAADGIVWSWGNNTSGQLGNGTYTKSNIPVKMLRVGDVIDISAGEDHVILQRRDARIYTVGSNTYGALGDGTTARRNTPTLLDLNNVAQISAGAGYSAITTLDGSVYTWGYNNKSQLGNNDTARVLVPTKIDGISNVKNISAGINHVLAITKNEEIYTWGSNTNGQLGNGTIAPMKVPTKIAGISNVLSVSAGQTYSLSIRTEGTVFQFGDITHGTNLSNNTTYLVPTAIGSGKGMLDKYEIALKEEESDVLHATLAQSFNVMYENSDDNSKFIFKSQNADIATVDSDGVITARGIGMTRILVTNTITNKTSTCLVNVTGKENKVYPQVLSGNNFTVILKADGSIWTLGYNSNGELGNGTYLNGLQPKQIDNIYEYVKIAVGNSHVLALKSDGTVVAWGLGTSGQLGNGAKLTKNTPVKVSQISDIVDIEAGGNHSLAVDKFGRLFSWGDNTDGQLGNGTYNKSDVPIHVTGITEIVRNVDAYGNHTLAVGVSGKVYGFGSNAGFVLGNNQNDVQNIPLEISGIQNASMVATGSTTTEILLDNGDVITFGNNNATKVTICSDIVYMEKGNAHTILLDKNKQAYTYGNNVRGQLGTGDNVTYGTPTRIMENTINIGAGHNNTYVILENGYVYGFGDNANGQLGDNTKIDRNIPTLMANRTISTLPEEVIVEVGEEKTITATAPVFNVLYNNAQNDDFEYIMEENEFAELENNVVTGLSEGKTTLTVTYTLTGEEKEVNVIVLDPENNKIKSIVVNNDVEAKLIDVKKYEATINSDANSATVTIETINPEDRISLDSINYSTNKLTKTISIPNKENEITVYVKLANDTVVEYKLIVIKKSNIVDLSTLTVNGIPAKSVSATEFEAIIEEDDFFPEIYAKTKSEYAKVGIDGQDLTPIEATEYILMGDEVQKTVPIVVESESGKQEVYILRLYKKSILTGLEWVKVDGEVANQNGPLSYTTLVKYGTTSVNVETLAKYDKAQVYINGTLTTEKTIDITKDITTVSIKVIGEGKEETYTLTIYRHQNEANLDLLYVNGVLLTPVGNVYETTISSIADTAEVRGVSIKEGSLIDIAGLGAQLQDTTRTLNLDNEVNEFKIVVTNSENEEEYTEYTLIIRKPSANTNLSSVTVGTGIDTIQADYIGVDPEDSEIGIYYAKVKGNVSEVTVKGVAEYVLASVDIAGSGFKEKENSSKATITDDGATVRITVKAQDGTEKEYKLIIEKMPNNTGINTVTVDGKDATKINDTTYEYYLDEVKTQVDVDVKLDDILAELAINNNLFEVKEMSKAIEINGKTTTVTVHVKAQDETLKTYTLKIYALPDNTNITQIFVGDDEAVLEVGTNTYKAKVDKDLTEADIKVIAEDTKATVEIVGRVTNIAKAEDTITLTPPETTVNIRITAQDGTYEDYVLVIAEKSSNTNLAMLKADGNIISPNDDGEYYYTVKSIKTSVVVLAYTEDENAKVRINNLPEKTNTTSGTISITDDPISITVIAEDGTEETYILNIRKMSGNTEILSLDVDGNVLEVYEYKVFNETEVNVNIVLKDALSEVSIDGEPFVKTSVSSPASSVISIDSEEMLIPIVVKAEDGTIETYTLKLVKASDDNTIFNIEIEGVSSENIVQTDIEEYEAKILNTSTTAKIKVTTNHKLAKVKIGNNEYELNTTEHTINVPTDVTEVTITVRAENGEEQSYTLKLIKIFDLSLTNMQVDGIDAEYANNMYSGWTGSGSDDANVKIFVADERVKVSIDGGEEKTGTSVFEVPVDGTSKTVTVRVSAPDGSGSETYTLTIKRKSNDSTLQIVNVDGKTASLDEETNTYTVEVPIKSGEYSVTATTNEQNAYVEIGNLGQQKHTTTKSTTLNDDGTATVTITVTAQDGTSTEYTLIIVQVSDNNTIDKLTVNGEEPEKLKDGTYLIFVPNDDQEAVVYAESEHLKAKVKIDDFDEEEHVSTQTINLTGGETQVVITITAPNGAEHKYYLTIKKISNDAYLERISIGSKDADIMDESIYYISVPEKDSYDVIIKATNEYAQIEVNGQRLETKGTGTANVTLSNDKITEVNIKIIAQDGVTTRSYTLKIEKVSSDVSIKNVKVNNVGVTDYDENTRTYSIIVSKTLDTVPVYVELNNQYSSIKIDEEMGLGSCTVAEYAISTDINIVTLTVIAEDGITTGTYYLKIIKLSDNSGIDKVTYDGKEVTRDDDGNYYVTTNEDNITGVVQVYASNEFAKITINNDTENVKTGINYEVIELTERKIEIPIKVVAEDGTSTTNATLTIQKVSTNTELEYVKVGSKTVTEKQGNVYTAFIDKSLETVNIEAKALSQYSTVEIDVNSAKPTLTVPVSIAEEITTVTITVISEGLTSSQYILRLIQISDDNSLEYVTVNGIKAEVKVIETEINTGTDPEADPDSGGDTNTKNSETIYYIQVSEDIENVKLEAKATNQYAEVKISDTGYNPVIQTKGKHTLEEGKTTEVKVLIKAQDGTVKEYTLVIEKISDNANIEIIKLNDISVTDFDEATNTYKAFIRRLSETEDIYIKTESEYASINIQTANKKGEITTSITGLDLDEESIDIPIVITSEKGGTKTYTLNLTRLSNITEIEKLEVNGVEYQKDEIDPTKYIVPIVGNMNIADIYVKTESPYALVDLNAEVPQLGENSTIMAISKTATEIVIPIIITAQDGTTKEYSIVFKRLSADSSISTLKVDGDIITANEQDIYEYIVKYGTQTVDLSILLNDEFAKLSINGESFGAGFNITPANKTITLNTDSELTTVTILVTAEDGTSRTYYLKITRCGQIIGSVVTENVYEKHIATITVYRTNDTRDINDPINPREVIDTITTNDDGTFKLDLLKDKYDLVITKPGYLSYTITGIEVTKDEVIDLGEKELIAGDLKDNGVIDASDMIVLNDNFGVLAGDSRYSEKYDINGDGIVDNTDKNIIKKNYTKKNIVEAWVKPMAVVSPMSIRTDIQTLEDTTSSINEEQDVQTSEEINNDTIITNELDIPISTDMIEETVSDEISTNSLENVAIDEQESFIIPVTTNYTVTCEYGMRIHPVTGAYKMHTGIDIVPEHNSKIISIADGIVVFAGDNGAFGNAVEIEHEIDGETIYSFYAHLSEIKVEVGQTVGKGEIIGLEGGAETDDNPGSSTGHHLHFEIRTSSGYGNDVNPRDYIEFAEEYGEIEIVDMISNTIITRKKENNDEDEEDLGMPEK